jgi:hypothetical protein
MTFLKSYGPKMSYINEPSPLGIIIFVFSFANLTRTSTQLFKKNNKKLQGKEFNAFLKIKYITLNSTWTLEFGVQTW